MPGAQTGLGGDAAQIWAEMLLEGRVEIRSGRALFAYYEKNFGFYPENKDEPLKYDTVNRNTTK